MLHHVLVSSFLVLTLAAQTTAKPPAPLTAKAFLPDDHRHVACADLAAMRTRGIWDELEVSVMKMIFSQLEREIGFPLASLDRVTMVAALPDGIGGNQLPKQIVVFEGNAPLPLHDRVAGWPMETIANHEVRRRPNGRDLLVQPRPELYVEGLEEWVRRPLEGQPYTGAPCADVMSLLSGRADQLAYFAIDITHPQLKNNLLAKLFPDVEWPEGEAPTFLCLRVLVLGDADDPHLGIEAVLRHAREGEGVTISEKAADAFLAGLPKIPEMRAALPVLKKVEKKRDHGDLVYGVDLGRARDAIGHLATLAVPIFTPRMESMERRVGAEAPVPAPPPPPPQPKK
jgi:hypothetical protein